MSLIDFDGFDAGDFAQKWAPTGSVAGSTSTRYGVGRSIVINGGTAAVSKSFTAVSKVVVGFAYSYSTVTTGQEFLFLYGDGGTTQHLGLYWVSAGVLGLRRGATTQLGSSATVLAPVTPIWHYFEVSATISDTVGTVEVRVDGATVITFTGDTKNAGTNSTIDGVRLRATGTSTADLFDDFYLLDNTGSAPYNDFLGEVRVYTTVPTGAGASTQWTPSAGTNFGAVDELPFSAADNVQTATSGFRDTYAMGDLPANIATVYAVRTTAVAKKSDAGAASLKVVDRSGGTNYYGTTTALNAADLSVPGALRTVDPATSSAWTTSGVNALEAGVELA